MTLSIAGFCRETGQFGAAITSSSICVASRCVFVGPRHGVVLTQNVTNPVLGQLGLEHLHSGLSAGEVLTKLLDSEDYPEWRQLQVLDAHGDSAVHSGAETLGIHATRAGNDCVAGGNMLAEASVVDVTVAAFENATGELAERLLVALAAGVDAGGEMGPVHSAGLKVTSQASWPVVDLRVDWHDDPIVELRQLWTRYLPQRDDYVCRAVRPDESPSYGVPGDVR
ncbi:DUF1028 domain-containing protein [Larsenimonas rhizosphaerae]|uniref:DUF1028 domain-containing protein n=1 Tax=Larsenimonas rhizosphaerae TaxID=2944682 RepID=A0AA41ZIS2_9GAMM|nr:DUF1028 domain-containing protein [Larsenimonas rhizosphaerae]MCX2525385.1 DUF1028 domain-containing protein [Larsenimonas rhizosphaerae]